jgi:hypothetical protein
LLETIVRRKSVSWSVEGYLLPSGAAGTVPDGWDVILEAAFGLQTTNASTSIVYTLIKEYAKSITLHRALGNSGATSVFAEMVRGAVPQTVEFMLSGQDEAKIKVSGFAADVLRAGHTLVASDNGTVVNVTSGDGAMFDAGQYINVNSQTNQLIASIATDAITLPAHTAGNSSELVVPSACVTSQTYVATAVPVAGISGSCSLAGSSLDILSAKIVLNNGAVAHNNKYGVDKTDSFHLGNRSVTGEVTVRLLDTNFVRIAKTKNATKVALSLVSGTAAGSIATFTLANVILDYTAIPSDASEDIIVTVPFTAYASSSLEDELVLTLT